MYVLYTPMNSNYYYILYFTLTGEQNQRYLEQNVIRNNLEHSL